VKNRNSKLRCDVSLLPVSRVDVETDSGIEQDAQVAQSADGDDAAQTLTTSVQGCQGERLTRALTKVDEKKKKRIARQKQACSVRRLRKERCTQDRKMYCCPLLFRLSTKITPSVLCHFG